MFKITVTAALASRPTLERAAVILQNNGVKRVRIDQYDSRYYHPRRNETLAAARLRFIVESYDDFKRLIEAAGISHVGVANVKEKWTDEGEEE